MVLKGVIIMYRLTAGWIKQHLKIGLQAYSLNIQNRLPIRNFFILDGHVSHISLDLIHTARAHNIHILCLPLHSTHLLQPLDVEVFKPDKTAWRSIFGDYHRVTNFSNIEKEAFPRLLRSLTKSGAAFLVAGFESTGLYPVRRQAVSLDQILANKTFSTRTRIWIG